MENSTYPDDPLPLLDLGSTKAAGAPEAADGQSLTKPTAPSKAARRRQPSGIAVQIVRALVIGVALMVLAVVIMWYLDPQRPAGAGLWGTIMETISPTPTEDRVLRDKPKYDMKPAAASGGFGQPVTKAKKKAGSDTDSKGKQKDAGGDKTKSS